MTDSQPDKAVIGPDSTVRMVDRDTHDAVSCYHHDGWKVSASWGPLIQPPQQSFAAAKSAAKLILRERSKRRGRRRLVLDTTVYECFDPKVHPFP